MNTKFYTIDGKCAECGKEIVNLKIDYALRHSLDCLYCKGGPMVWGSKMKLDRNLTKGDMIKEAGLKVYDTAMPIDLVRDIQDKAGQNPVPHCVYSYDENRYGEMYPLTETGKIILAIYAHIIEKENK